MTDYSGFQPYKSISNKQTANVDSTTTNHSKDAPEPPNANRNQNQYDDNDIDIDIESNKTFKGVDATSSGKWNVY
eukprot:CAMPEP_0116925280 /NCGR_PEP_ID=MMETSP0467-20121206/24026_1 /TAXON_ID=283647 /ORGANISM="Mesodinium pulex, Strain SPMC105" /LENGTH=74 /DNA_ID=CAMNT_0004604297 /DNA_START=337 /DNA_END=561 /DNA_ORIENTATION=-